MHEQFHFAGLGLDPHPVGDEPDAAVRTFFAEDDQGIETADPTHHLLHLPEVEKRGRLPSLASEIGLNSDLDRDELR